MERTFKLVEVADYEPLIGPAAVDRILAKAKPLRGLRIANVNSTYYGGGVAEMLSAMTLLMDSVGIQTEWRVIQGSPDFFTITKKMHNGLQGESFNLTERKKQIYEKVLFENSRRNILDHEVVVIHDPQPLPLIDHYKKRGPWLWRCHIDLTNPNRELWNYLVPFVEKYDSAILSIKEYRQNLTTPQLFFMPATDPFSGTNCDMSDKEADDRLKHYDIPTDLPIVVQISRFDRWKDPEGVIRAADLARKDADFRLVLLGNIATDDPEGEQVYDEIMKHRDDRTIILCHQDTALVNALQRRAAVVLQKSIREGFGLTVSEAMWKGTPVIGGNVGGIRYQIVDGQNGFLVSSTEETADRIVRLVKDADLRQRMGTLAKETVRRKFLLTRLLEQY
ncbi:MAG: glycosyltransferase, partial [Planctomycetota bacterium]